MITVLDLSISELRKITEVVKDKYSYDFTNYASSSFKRRILRILELKKISLEQLVDLILKNQFTKYWRIIFEKLWKKNKIWNLKSQNNFKKVWITSDLFTNSKKLRKLLLGNFNQQKNKTKSQAKIYYNLIDNQE